MNSFNIKEPSNQDNQANPLQPHFEMSKAKGDKLEEVKVQKFGRIWEKMGEWEKNAIAGKFKSNFNLLREIISDSQIPNQELYKFFIAEKIRPNGGWFVSQEKPTQVALDLIIHRNLDGITFFKQAKLEVSQKAWNENAAEGNDIANEHLLSELISDKGISDQELYQFFIAAKIRPNGGWFLLQEKPTQVALDLIIHRNLDSITFFKQAKLEVSQKAWNENAAGGNDIANEHLLSELISDKGISDQELYQFFIAAKLRPNGGWFLLQEKPTQVALDLIIHRNLDSITFFKQAKLEVSQKAWNENAAGGNDIANEHLLSELISDKGISDQELYQFFIAAKLRPNGGWFLLQEKPTQVALDLITHRNLNSTDFFHQFDISKKEPPMDEVFSKKLNIISEKLNVLVSNDLHFNNVQNIAKLMTKQYPPTIPDIPLSDDEKNAIERKYKTAKYLETKFLEKYADDFNNIGWHGRLSLQRVAWQDEEFAQAIRDPLMVKAILLRGKNKEEDDLGGGSTLSSMLLYGLSSNRLSYLTTVAPNWAFKPQIEGVTWSKLEDMRLPSQKDETPRKVTEEYLEDITAGLQAIETVFKGIMPGGVSSNVDQQKVHDQISQASPHELLNKINSLLNNRNQVEVLVQGVAGASTGFLRMNGQCLEVMSEYNRLLQHNKGDHAAVLGYGLISHALDARHLAAAIYGIKEGLSYSNQGSELKDAQNILKDVLDKAAAGTLGKEATALVAIRLQQILTLIVENREKMGINLSEIAL